MITLAIRFDDPSVTSNRSVEEAFIAALARWRLQATLAVIPFRLVNGQSIRLDRERASHIARAVDEGRVEVALHGHSHLQRSQTPGGRPSEFWGLRPALQASLLAEGLEVLHHAFGNVVSGFVPPWNTYDPATVAAMNSAGLQYVSADLKGAAGGFQLPRTCRMVNVRRAVAEARQFVDGSCVIIAVVHHYDFAESGEHDTSINYPLLDGLFGWLAEQNDIRVETLAELARRAARSKLDRAVALRRLRDRMPKPIAQALPAESMMLTPLHQLSQSMRAFMRTRARPA